MKAVLDEVPAWGLANLARATLEFQSINPLYGGGGSLIEHHAADIYECRVPWDRQVISEFGLNNGSGLNASVLLGSLISHVYPVDRGCNRINYCPDRDVVVDVTSSISRWLDTPEENHGWVFYPEPSGDAHQGSEQQRFAIGYVGGVSDPIEFDQISGVPFDLSMYRVPQVRLYFDRTNIPSPPPAPPSLPPLAPVEDLSYVWIYGPYVGNCAQEAGGPLETYEQCKYAFSLTSIYQARYHEPLGFNLAGYYSSVDVRDFSDAQEGQFIFEGSNCAGDGGARFQPFRDGSCNHQLPTLVGCICFARPPPPSTPP